MLNLEINCIKNQKIELDFGKFQYSNWSRKRKMFTAFLFFGAKNMFEMMVVEIGMVDWGFTERIAKVDLKKKQLFIKGAHSLLMTMKNTKD